MSKFIQIYFIINHIFGDKCIKKFKSLNSIIQIYTNEKVMYNKQSQYFYLFGEVSKMGKDEKLDWK